MGRKRSKSASNSTSESNIEDENAQEEEIVIDFDQTTKYDASNPLVIVPRKKGSKKLKVKEKTVVTPKPLSKKQRKKLQKIIETKKKKLNRAELFEKLSQVQASSEDIDHLASTSDMQTFGIRRFINENDCSINKKKISNIRGINKKCKTSHSKKRKLEENSDTNSESEETKNIRNSESEESENFSQSETDESAEENESLLNNKETREEEIVCEEKKTENNIQNDDEQNKQSVNKVKNTVPQISKENVNHEKVHIPTVFVPVHRNPDIQVLREALPIYAEEQPLMEAIRENSVVIIHGETGSGKTTQVPQFLYEAGFTQNSMLIGITEPRRIAAMSMAARVGEEMNMPKAVSYHIRYEKTVNPETKIKFMTDGVLLKEMKNDFHLSRYSVIIIDEAHERSVFSDVLIGLLSRVVLRHKFKKRNYPPLKLIIMSATMCVEEFMGNPRLFKEPPFLFKVTSRQYTVQAHFNKYTPEDYVEAAYNKVCKIHRQLPSGAILVFLTGENEIKQLCKLLQETFPSKEIESDMNAEEKENSNNPVKLRKRRKKRQGQSESFLPDIDLDNYTIEPLDTEDLQHQLSEDEEQKTTTVVKKFDDISHPLIALPLYSILPLEDQEKIFKPPPPGCRLCVVATNVAETSITIPGLKYVVDSGKVKTKVYNKNSGGISKFVITWCSKASSNQRAGRAGRTEGGHCYRLYSSAVFDNEFPDFSPPEIQRIPADDVLLQMKALGITNVVDFPFPSAPDAEALKAAERRLVLLGALKDYKEGYGKFSAPVTLIGKAMARFPLSPRYAAMLLLSKKHKCVPYIVAIVCAMTVTDVFVSSTVNYEDEEEGENIKVMWPGIKKIGAGKGVYLRLGDAMVLLRAVALYESSKNKVKFCIKNGIRHRAMVEIHKMQLQLYKEISQAFTDVNMPQEVDLEYPSEEEIEKVRKILAAGLTDHIARKLPAEESKKDKSLKNAYQCMELEEPVFIHPSSILFKELPEYVAYQEIAQTTKYFMKGVVEIEDSWIPSMVPSICEFSDPLQDPPPLYDKENDKILVTMDVKIGPWSWEVRVVDIEIPKGVLKYKWFCFFLLEGQIWKYFEEYKKLTKPSIVLKDWAKSLAPRMMLFLNALISKDIDCRKALQNQWQTDTSYLLKEFLGLIPPNKHLEVECKWPPKF